MKIKKWYYFFIALIILFFLLWFAGYFYVKNSVSNEESIVIIPPKTSTYKIAEVLEQHKVIHNKYVFVFFAKVLQNYSKKSLLSGEYKFDKGVNVFAILKQLMHGKVVRHKLTIPEGYTSSEVTELIQDLKVLSNTQKKLQLKEGKILPGTYFYTHNMEEAQLINNMQSAMNELLEENWDNRSLITKLMLKNKEEVLILASIVEKEAVLDNERAMIARVYINRIQKKMPLQADPTVIYGITNGYKTLNRKLTFKDLKHESPYNTYLNRGLPPTPICNPGKASILAVLHPDENNALYFVADNKGGHIFAETFEEHKMNIKKVRSSSLQPE